MRHVTAANFKATCLRLMDEVGVTRERITITKRGRAIAQLVPMEVPLGEVLGGGRGTGVIHGDLLAPLAEDDWEANL